MVSFFCIRLPDCFSQQTTTITCVPRLDLGKSSAIPVFLYLTTSLNSRLHNLNHHLHLDLGKLYADLVLLYLTASLNSRLHNAVSLL